jgi:proteasome lid subunit RPN8/RPN11
MKPSVLQISPTQRSELSRLALSASPAECCGLLVGHSIDDRLIVTAIHPSENLATDKHISFEIDFRIRLHLEEDLADGPGQLIGLYHSHPGGQPAPSNKDLTDASEPDLVWLILAVDAVGAVDLCAWQLLRSNDGEKSFSGLPISVE